MWPDLPMPDDDHAPAATQHQLDGGDEGTGKACAERSDRTRLGVEDVAGEGQCALCVHGARGSIARAIAHIGGCNHRAKYTFPSGAPGGASRAC